MPLILGAQSATAGGYSIDNSCRFNDGGNPKLVRSGMSAGDQTKWTLSWWFKRGYPLTTTQSMFSCLDDATHDFQIATYTTTDDFVFEAYTAGTYAGRQRTDRVFRDVSAWYHAVCVWDSDAVSATERMRIYINGTEITSFSTDTEPSTSATTPWNGTSDETIGCYDTSGLKFDGYMAEIVFCDGQAYAASDFGEFNTDSPTIWQPKDPSGLTFGTQGFWLDMKDSSDFGNDVSGNGNDFTSSNLDATDQATDTPTNNFCVMNPLDNKQQASVFSEGNCKFQTSDGPLGYNTGTIGVSSGKWYFEAKVAAETTANAAQIGVSDNTGEEQYVQWTCYPYIGTSVNGYSYKGNGYYANDNTSSGTGFSTYTTSIISVYLDLDNYKIYWAKDNVMENSGTGKWGAALPAVTFMLPACGDFVASYNVTLEMDFGGCPAFAISSGNTDVNGYGNFEYDPSRGGASDFDGSAKDFLAICTKNLGSDGG